MDVRLLDAEDAADFQRVFLRGLTDHPEAFAVSTEEQAALPVETLAGWFSAPDNRFYGAFDDEALVGIAVLQRYGRAKLQHRAGIGPMYVTPETRGRGVGKDLLNRAVNDARAWRGLEDVILAVTVGNEPARRLYLQAGFQPYSTDPRLLKVADRYFDVEWMILPLHR